ncbi:MAG: Lrp/AsnC family transcriptional regulator [Promethearchaeota archaeon]
MRDNDKDKIGEVDLNILQILSEDGRKSYKFIADNLNKSPVTIKKHVEELEKKGIIKDYGVNIDFEKLGYDIIAFIEITISKGKMLNVEEDIALYPNIFGVYDVTGTYDAVILARFKTRRELSEIVKRINSSKNVVRTNTHLILNVIKRGTSFIDLLKYERTKIDKM